MPTAVVALDKLQSDIDLCKTRLESLSKHELEERPNTRSTTTRAKAKPKTTGAERKYDDLLQSFLGKLKDWSERMEVVRRDIAVEPNQRIVTDMEMGTQSEDAGSVRQHEIPEPSHARACTLAQHVQPCTSENGIANGEACEASGDSIDDTRVDTTIYASDPAEDVSMERAPRVDTEPVAVEASNRGSHARAASCHHPIKPLISTEREERQTDIHNATAGQLLPDHGREDQVDAEPAEVQTQLSTDRPGLANSDDASANDNSMDLIPLGPVQQEDTPISEVEPKVTQQTAITDAIAPNSDNTSANNNNSIQSITASGPIQQEDSPMSDVEPEVTQQTAITDAVAGANHRRPATPGVARPSSNSEVGENSTWSSQHSDTSETLSPTSSTASGTDSIQTRFTTPDSTSMGEQVDKSPISENNTSIPDDQADESCYERYFIESKDTPTLVRDQLGKDMLRTLDELSKLPNYVNKATLPWITEKASQFNPKDELKPEGDPDVQFNKFEKKDEDGIVVSRDDPIKGRKFEWPDFE
ncbi:uncharacterized protein FFB20_12758 [Fusarium fujikuroi]|nr:uncharacterized protein FFC1_09356 [Fusarium fujikuroi]SCO07042.1 uncharacterized protein FFB20_12758 [Fusarium fujikuroi]SCO35615.1 uncharacterized protein FFNC_04631 [Fusarium fujikuroi]